MIPHEFDMYMVTCRFEIDEFEITFCIGDGSFDQFMDVYLSPRQWLPGLFIVNPASKRISCRLR